MKRIYEVPVYKTIVQVGFLRVKASSAEAAKKAARGNEELVSSWDLVEVDSPYSLPEHPQVIEDGDRCDVEGK